MLVPLLAIKLSSHEIIVVQIYQVKEETWLSQPLLFVL